jgi:hypothetical protein
MGENREGAASQSRNQNAGDKITSNTIRRGLQRSIDVE